MKKQKDSPMNYRDEIVLLPMPTEKQYTAFAHHLCYAHSWYKHLSLLEGGDFVIFLAEDAGAGYTREHARLHHTWKTTEQYRQRFGYLDYMWRFSAERRFLRDGLGRSEQEMETVLPLEILRDCSFTLYPYVSTDLNAMEAISYDVHEEAIECLQEGEEHSERELILQWHDLYMASEKQWIRLDPEERKIANKLLEQKHALQLDGVPIKVVNCVEVQMQCEQVYDTLQRREFAKIRYHLDLLRKWLEDLHHHKRTEPTPRDKR
jgi:hypothetical protein